MSSLTQIEQSAQVGAQLANAYLMGGLAEQAGIPVNVGNIQSGVDVQVAATAVMTDLGIQIAPPESGSALLSWQIRAAATRAALTRTTASAARALSAQPMKWAGAFAIAAGGAGLALGTYSWMSEDTEVRLAQVNAAQANIAEAMKNMTPEQRSKIAQQLATQSMSLPPSYTWAWIAGAVALGAFAVYRVAAK